MCSLNTWFHSFFHQTLEMLSLPPPPPLPCRKPTSLNQIVIQKQAMMKQQTLETELPYVSIRKVKEQPILRQPRRTNPIVWCGAILCLIFSLILIFFGVATLIVFLNIKPRVPVFDIPAASLNLIYFDSPEYFNGDFTFLTNFSNPNRKIDVRFEQAEIELYFSNSLVATQALMPFTERRGEARMVSVHMISSLVYLPPNLAIELQKQVQSNRVTYNIRGTFRVRANLGLIHYSYWLHGRCQLETSSPPTGVLLARSCRTKR
ncbi:Late embryogenesis abundant protein, LEA-14 protein [Actinidia chinensis var. chinensis]|uniref:Late embryogenesis abundant protein, LEA-14 protein n=1 Tax=Actinidia chinensis var. chinensis TaxID=1590841 RepID=A0A2R6P562_ACTCC|nr:Late embryogenesis abundant protein, LEA-14 protein [Actinidia chinensis var. chinensis]